jgi:hypothetical protein
VKVVGLFPEGRLEARRFGVFGLLLFVASSFLIVRKTKAALFFVLPVVFISFIRLIRNWGTGPDTERLMAAHSSAQLLFATWSHQGTLMMILVLLFIAMVSNYKLTSLESR